jgi:hypothetical protein
MGTELTVQTLPPTDPANTDLVSYFIDSENDILENATSDCSDSHMVGLTIRYDDEKVEDLAVRISFRRNDQLSAEAISSVFEKFVQSKNRFGALDKLVIQTRAVRMTSVRVSRRPRDRFRTLIT